MNREDVSSVGLEENRKFSGPRPVAEAIIVSELRTLDDLAATSVQPKDSQLGVPCVEDDDLVGVAAEINVHEPRLEAFNFSMQV